MSNITQSVAFERQKSTNNKQQAHQTEKENKTNKQDPDRFNTAEMRVRQACYGG